jgi:ribosomal protein S2
VLISLLTASALFPCLQVFKFAQYIGAKSLAGRHTPGTFTNQIQKQFEEPRLLILTGATAAANCSNTCVRNQL